MLTELELRELVSFSNGDDPVLSVYLNTKPGDGNADAGKLRLRNLLKPINLHQDVNTIEQYIHHEYKWNGGGVAVFSCAARNYFRAFPLALPVRDMAYVGDRPSVKPLLDLFDNYGGYGIVLVDKQGARLFTFHLGELVEHDPVEGESVKHVKAGGASSIPGRRGGASGQKNTLDETIERNMRETVELTVHFFEEHNIRRIILGGAEDNVALFRSYLPKAWLSLIVGSFAINKAVSQSEVFQHAQQIALEYTIRREKDQLDTLLVKAAKGDQAVVGLSETLKMVNLARVQTLLVVENFNTAGNRCDSCGYLTTEPIKICPTCGGKIFKYQDVIDLAVSEVIKHGGDVLVTHVYQPFINAGSTGAFLRY